MSCQQVQDLLHGYIDGELDLVKSLDIEAHLQTCQACTQVHQQQRALRAAIQSSNLYFTPPPQLEQRVRAAVRRSARPGTGPSARSWRWLGMAAAFAVATVALWQLLPLFTSSSSETRLAQELVASHVRSLMVDHLTDVPSSDSHTVKPWFEGKLDFSPPVLDLAEQGFSLVGGRLDYVDNRPVAALVYHRRQHVINLYCWPAGSAADSDTLMLTSQGYHVVRWRASGMTYQAVSNLNPSELQEFVQAVQREQAANPAL